MPARNQNLVNGEIYHVFNKSIHLDIFKDFTNAEHFLNLFRYYQSSESTISFSRLRDIEIRERKEILTKIYDHSNDRVKIIAFAIMPNHFHFLLEQVMVDGVVNCVSNAVNSFTRSYNLKNDNLGPLFLPRFKAVRVKSEEQLLHNSRYIHLNHLTAQIISKKELLTYKLNSFHEYYSNPSFRFTDESRILGLNPSKKDRIEYRKFVYSRIDYQQELSLIEHPD